MIALLPVYISIVFCLTTFLTICLLFRAVPGKLYGALPFKILFILIPVWLFSTATLALTGFYQKTDIFPPRVFLAGVLPALLVITFYFVFFRKTFIEKLNLKTLTLLHIIRIPVEFVIYWLAQNEQMPLMMSFEGRNFDILSGLTAPVIFWLAFRRNKINKPLLVGWNLAALGLLSIVVAIAFLSFPTPNQLLNLEIPNRAVSYFPFIWLPAMIVPVVLFSHLNTLWQILFAKPEFETQNSAGA